MLVSTQWHKAIIYIGMLIFPFFHGNSSRDTKVNGQAQSQIRGHSLEGWADYCMMDQLPWWIPGKGMNILGSSQKKKNDGDDGALKGAG